MDVIIVDDEKLARENLKMALDRYFPELTIIGEADSVKTGYEIISKNNAKLVFLDIDLFDGSGFNLLKKFDEVNFHVIFVTAYNKFAIKAFRVNALDYILKPIQIKELREAVEKAQKVIRNGNNDSKSKQFKRQDEERIAIKEKDGIRFLFVREIRRCKADNNYTEIYLLNGEKLLSSKTLKEYDAMLAPFGFFRIHQSHLINLKKVQKIIKKDGVFVELDNGDLLEVARRKKEALQAEMLKF